MLDMQGPTTSGLAVHEHTAKHAYSWQRLHNAILQYTLC